MTLNIAHRGFSGFYPENTLLAFEKALQLGVDAIELDVQLSSDGEMVVFHDEELARTTGEKGWLKSRTLGDLRTLDASGDFKGVYGVNRIPTLDEYFELIAGKDILTLVELKNSMVCYPGLEEKVAECVHRFNQQQNVILYSANHLSVIHFGRIAPDVRLLLPFDNWIFGYGAYCRRHGVSLCMPYFRALTPEVMAEFNENGVSVYPWTVDETADMQQMLDLGVAGMLTNRPDRLQALLAGT